MPGGRVTRYWRHSATDHGTVNRAFPEAQLDRIQAAIVAGEKQHGGQVMFAVEGALPLARVHKDVTPRERALEVFGLLRVWDTEHNNGVLIYLLLADRDVEIIADRGIAKAVPDTEWRTICAAIESASAAGKHADGVVEGIHAVSAVLGRHFPHRGDSSNELPDRPVVL